MIDPLKKGVNLNGSTKRLGFNVDVSVQNCIFEQLRTRVQNLGYTFNLGLSEVKKLMETANCDATVWSLTTPKEELELLTDKTVKKLRRQGQTPKPRAPSDSTLSIRNGFGAAVLGRRDIRRTVQETRRDFWGTVSAPFDCRNQPIGSEEQSLKQAQDWIRSISAPGQTKLLNIEIQLPQTGSDIDRFHAAVTHLSHLTDGYWDTDKACIYVLCDLYQGHKITFEFRLPVDFYSSTTLTITVRGPITPEALRDSYAEQLEKWQIQAYKLTKTQVALLNLYAETPGQTWTERLKLWDYWCESTSGLKKFSAPERRAEKLSNAHLRAFKRCNWDISEDGELGWLHIGDSYWDSPRKVLDSK